MLCQQAQMDWMKDGDRNTKFFHAISKEPEWRNFHFFVDLFSASPYHIEERFFDSLPKPNRWIGENGNL